MGVALPIVRDNARPDHVMVVAGAQSRPRHQPVREELAPGGHRRVGSGEESSVGGAKVLKPCPSAQDPREKGVLSTRVRIKGEQSQKSGGGLSGQHVRGTCTERSLISPSVH